MNINEYLTKLGPIPSFLKKYLKLNSLKRLQKVGYFCGMDYASKDIYNFSFYISRFDHSLSTALLTWKYTQNKKATLAALFHDIATPCFSHVIDYMNEDYELQESTEAKTKELLFHDLKLQEMLKKDNILIDSILDFKKYSIVDTNRPKLCSDRLDGIILTSLGWTKSLVMSSINEILKSIEVYKNEDNELELGFKDIKITKKILYLNEIINQECHSNYDTYMMLLLADITKYAINKKVITYDNLYYLNEDEIIQIFQNYAYQDNFFSDKLKSFFTITMAEIPHIKTPNIKNRLIKPLTKGQRYMEKSYYHYLINNYQFTIAEEDDYITMISLNKTKLNFNYQETPLIKQTKKELIEYFQKERKSFSIPLKLTGTKFQNLVWTKMREIPYGQTVTYQELAIMIGNKNYARAVGLACHNNKILILIPCHRVVGTNNLGGFNGGINIKMNLLELENIF